MVTFFIFCASIGGTVLLCQFVLTLIGVGADDLDIGGEAGALDADAGSLDGHDAHGHHGSTWLFGVISFRTMVAAMTFFGLGGLLAESLNQRAGIQIVVALASGVAAMYVVHSIVRLIGRLSEDGTVRIQRAIGREATVYLTIPPHRTGVGKIHLNLQARLLEYPAVTTNGEKLATGSKVMVIGVEGADTLEVEPVREQVEAA